MKCRPSPYALGRALGRALNHALAIASLLLAPATVWAAPGPQAGVSAAVRGSVLLGEVAHPDVAGRALATGDAVYLGNAIKAGPAAGMQLMLLDQTTVTLGENAELAVDAFTYDPGQNTGQISMNLTKGAFRLVTGGVSDLDPANTRIRTPAAAIGIRGTIVLISVSGAGTLVALGGPGPSADSRDRVGAVDVSTPRGSVSLTRPGFGTFVAPGQAPEAPRPLTPEEAASLSSGLSRDGASRDGEGKGRPSQAAASRATNASGASTAAAAGAATALSSQAASTSHATDQTTGNTQSSDYGRQGTQLPNTPLLLADAGGTHVEGSHVEGGHEERIMAGNLAPFSLASLADVAGLSGTARYGDSGVPLYDVTGLSPAEGAARVLGDPSGLARVGNYDFSAQVNFAARAFEISFSNVNIGDGRSYATTASRLTASAVVALSQLNIPLGGGPRGLNLSWQIDFMNRADGAVALALAQQVLVASGGASYRGQSLAPRTSIAGGTPPP
jgi:hypothetical protein